MRKRLTSGLPLPLPLGEELAQGMERSREDRLWARIRARRGEALGRHSEPPRAGQFLPAPLGRVLKIHDASSERSGLWRRIRARQNGLRQRARSFRLPALGFGLATGLAAALVLAGIVPFGPPTAAPAAASVPLTLANGFVLAPVDAAHGDRVVTLADASEIRLAKGARVEPLLSSGSRFELLLRRGSAEFSVIPGGPRRWVIEAGVATVEVVGTVFRVTRGPRGVQVSVSRGTVLVRGEGVPDRVRRVTAGQTISVAPAVAPLPKVDVGPAAVAEATDSPGDPGGVVALPAATAAALPDATDAELPDPTAAALPDPTAAARPEATAAALPDATAAAPRDATPAALPDATAAALPDATAAALPDATAAALPDATAAAVPAAPAAAWRRALARGAYKKAYGTLGAQGLKREVARTDLPQRLLELADVARLSGHPSQAVAPLDRLMTRHADSPQAGLAAFTLGRVYLDQLGEPAEAARAFEKAIGLHPPNALLADCHARLVEAYARAGDVSRAKRAASRYRALFPGGRQLADPRAWTPQ